MSWPNLSDLLVAADAPDAVSAPIGLVGAPLAAGSVTPGRCDLAPALLRATLKRIGRYDVEKESELDLAIADYGDADLETLTIEAAFDPIRELVSRSVSRHQLSLLIGGNNAVTRPGLHAMAEAQGLPLGDVGLITLDAHLDMRSTADGLSNGNPVRALLEDGLPGRNIVQIGIAPYANSRQMHDDAKAAGNHIYPLSAVESIGAEELLDQALASLADCKAIMVDCDIDLIDRSQFPAAPGGRPLGLDVRAYLRLSGLLAASPKVRLIDFTEWDPPLDPTDLSALTAARWVAECVAGFAKNRVY